uniref:G-protein coupled receptors family 1 profile domain-containing protein n=1 Tax=Pygocentrus nattereri TaxID=42514 RepID=A0A3B4C420_PYGNA
MNSTTTTEPEYYDYDYDYTHHPMNQTMDSPPCDEVCIFYAVTNVVIIVLGIAGNGLVIWTAGFKVKKSVVSTWYLSLAVSDFVFCSTLPFSVVYVVNKDWTLGVYMCKFIYFMLWLNMYSSIFLLVIISVDRCVLVMFPVWARNKRTIRKASVIVVLAWIVAAVCSTPSAVFRVIRHSTYKQQTTCIHKYSYMKNYIATVTCRFVSSFLIPFLIMFTCYVLIIRKLFNQRVRYIKPLKIMTVLIFAFLICWLPYHTHFSFILVSANSCLNPFLYAFMGKDVKEQCYAFRSKIENAIKEEEDQNANRGTAVTASGEFN